ncbi:unnamed protein product, partial [Mesorhabditis belari]|uniref:Uncharacterized protein n=1 Tax=Mesorhabditis belari TaxID=2138241 RepID=A0AAF3FSJ8_9BILA
MYSSSWSACHPVFHHQSSPPGVLMGKISHPGLSRIFFEIPKLKLASLKHQILLPFAELCSRMPELIKFVHQNYRAFMGMWL